MKRLAATALALLLSAGAYASSHVMESETGRAMIYAKDNCGDYRGAMVFNGKRVVQLPLERALEQGAITKEGVDQQIENFEGPVIEIRVEGGDCIQL